MNTGTCSGVILDERSDAVPSSERCQRREWSRLTGPAVYLYVFVPQGKVYAINTNPKLTYWASGNKFSHLNYTQFASQYLMKSVTPKASSGSKTTTVSTTLPTATTVNWVTAGKVTPVRDQAACGESSAPPDEC